MKLDSSCLVGSYIVLSDDCQRRNETNGLPICGPIESFARTDEGLVLVNDHETMRIYINLDKNGETNDIQFITRYLWQAFIYSTERRVARNYE